MFGKNKEKIQKAIPIISGLTGISSATLTAFFLESTDAGMAAGGFIQQRLADYLNRMLSPRQELRVFTASALAVNYIEEILKREELRNDGFFSEGTVSRSDAAEVVDSMLFAVGNEEQEKKIPYMAHLIANAAFDESISADSACYYLQIFRSLTYRQLCMINVVVKKDHFQLRDKSKVNMVEMNIPETQPNNLQEFFQSCEEDIICYEFLDLHIKGYITLQMSHNTLMVFNTFAMIPRTATLSKVVFNVYRHMNLCTIPDEDISPIVKALSK